MSVNAPWGGLLSEVEGRLLAHLPAVLLQGADAQRLERDGHMDHEIVAIKSQITNPDDEREGTDADPGVLGFGDPRVVYGCGHSVASYTVGELLERLRGDSLGEQHFFREALAVRAARGDASQIPELDEALVLSELSDLADRGFVGTVEREDGQVGWALTEGGLRVLSS